MVGENTCQKIYRILIEQPPTPSKQTCLTLWCLFQKQKLLLNVLTQAYNLLTERILTSLNIYTRKNAS